VTKAFDRKKIELVLLDIRRALIAGHPDTRAGRFNPNLGRQAAPLARGPADANNSESANN
jgi:hypothetical protein